MRRRGLHASSRIEVVWVISQWALFSSCTPVVAPHGHGNRDAGSEQSVEHASDPSSTESSESADETKKQASEHGSAKGEPSAGSRSGAAAAGGSAASSTNTAASGNADAGQQTASDAGQPASDAPIEPVSMVPLEPDQLWVPAELADSESLNTLSDLSLLPVLGAGRHRVSSSNERSGSASVTSTDLSFINVIAHGNRDVNNFVCASADAKYENDSSLPVQLDMASCPESYVRGLVLARAEGSGKMTRFYFSSESLFLNGKTGDEILRVYVDDNPRAALQVPLARVVTGGGGEFFALPFGTAANAYVVWYYPIAFSTKLVAVLDRVSTGANYYQVELALDPVPQKRVPSRSRLAGRDKANALLASSEPAMDGSRVTEHVTLTAGEEKAFMLSGPATVRELRVVATRGSLSALAPVRLATRWDGAAQASINLPLLDLFASSRAIVEKNNLLLAAAGGDRPALALRLPMPFQTRSDWTLTNTSSESVELDIEWLSDKKVPDREFGHLTVQVTEPPLPNTGTAQRVTVAAGSGRGRFVGLCGDLMGHGDRAWGTQADGFNMLHADFEATTDGEPAIATSGVADYADQAAGFESGATATFFAQSWGRAYDQQTTSSTGQISFCRWHVLGNELDFQRELSVTHQLGAYDASIIDRHHTIAFLYVP